MTNRRVAGRTLASLIFIFLLVQACLYFEFAYSFTVIFRGARNVLPSDPLPSIVWWYVAAGCVFAALGVIYLFDLARIRRWFVLLAVVSLAYGIWGYQQSSQILLSWSGMLHGDLVALEAASSVVFCALGIAGVSDWAARTRFGRLPA